jgi:Spy/CpxP family protein refolding chaperone
MMSVRAHDDDDEDEDDGEGEHRRRGRRGRSGMMGRRGMMGMMGHGMMGHGMMGQAGMIRQHFERLAQQLELTDEQRAQAVPLLSTHAKNFIRLRAEIDTLSIDVQQLLETDPIDLARAKQLISTIAAREGELRLEHITAMENMRKLLTPEQQKKFRAMRHHMLGGGMMRPGGMMGHGRTTEGGPRSR